ncbi:MAG: hypothetical protein ABEJ23_07755 [Haloarculaceae archaeon]
MERRDLTDVGDVDADVGVDDEAGPDSLLAALRATWALWVGAAVAIAFAAVAWIDHPTAGPFDQFLFGFLAVVAVLAAVGRTATLGDLL